MPRPPSLLSRVFQPISLSSCPNNAPSLTSLIFPTVFCEIFLFQLPWHVSSSGQDRVTASSQWTLEAITQLTLITSPFQGQYIYTGKVPVPGQSLTFIHAKYLSSLQLLSDGKPLPDISR